MCSIYSPTTYVHLSFIFHNMYIDSFSYLNLHSSTLETRRNDERTTQRTFITCHRQQNKRVSGAAHRRSHVYIANSVRGIYPRPSPVIHSSPYEITSNQFVRCDDKKSSRTLREENWRLSGSRARTFPFIVAKFQTLRMSNWHEYSWCLSSFVGERWGDANCLI